MTSSSSETAAVQLRRNVIDGATILVMMGLGAVLRTYGLAARGFWGDEINMWVSAVSDYRSTGTGPLPPLLHAAGMWITKSGDSFSFHLATMVFGVLFIPPMYFLGRALHGRRVGLFAALLTTLSPTAIFFAQEGRPYSIYHCWCALIYLGFVKAWVDDDVRYWALYGGGLVLGFLTHALTTHVAAGLALVVIIASDWANHREYVKARLFLGITLLSSVALVWLTQRFAPMQDFNGRFVLPMTAFVRTVLYYLGPGAIQTDGAAQPAYDIPALLFLGLAVAGGVQLWRKNRFLLWSTASIFFVSLTILYFTLGGRAWWPWGRYISHLLPLYILLIALFLGVWTTTVPRAAIAILLVFFLYLPGLRHWSRHQTYDRSARDRAQADMLLASENSVNGVILVVPDIAAIDPRWMVAQVGIFRRDKLPTYLATQFDPVREIKTVQEGVSKGLWSETVGETVPPGRYALIVSTAPDPTDGCRFLKEFQNIAACKDETPIQRNGMVLPVSLVNADQPKKIQ